MEPEGEETSTDRQGGGRGEPMEKKKYMTVTQMGELLGLKKTDRYWLIHKNLFVTKQLGGKTMVVVDSFEKWYANQIRYHKVCGTEPGLELRKHSYSARDISILLNIHEHTAYDLIKRKGLKTILVDGWKRVPKEDFDRWLASQTKYTLHDFSSWEPERNKGESSVKDMSGTADDCQEISQEDPDHYRSETCRTPYGYMTRKDAAAIAGVSTLTIYQWADRGHFPQRRAGKRTYIPEAEFRAWLCRREKGGDGDGSDHGEER